MTVSAIYWITEASKCRFAHLSRATEHVPVIFSLVRLLGVNQGKQQHSISAAFGSPSEVRYVPSGP